MEALVASIRFACLVVVDPHFPPSSPLTRRTSSTHPCRLVPPPYPLLLDFLWEPLCHHSSLTLTHRTLSNPADPPPTLLPVPLQRGPHLLCFPPSYLSSPPLSLVPGSHNKEQIKEREKEREGRGRLSWPEEEEATPDEARRHLERGGVVRSWPCFVPSVCLLCGMFAKP